MEEIPPLKMKKTKKRSRVGNTVRHEAGEGFKLPLSLSLFHATYSSYSLAFVFLRKQPGNPTGAQFSKLLCSEMILTELPLIFVEISESRSCESSMMFKH